jgi:RES domain
VAKLPEPPPVQELAAVAPEWAELPRGAELWRIHSAGGEHPVGWRSFRHHGPLDRRFDHHLPPPREQERGIYYAAREPATCLAEVFQGRRVIDPDADAPWLVGFRLARGLRLLDLTGRFTTRAGASMAIHAGPHRRARAWSRALYEAFPGAQGLLCCSSMDSNRRTVVLYERARLAFPARPSFHRPLADPGLRPHLRAAAAALGYRLA